MMDWTTLLLPSATAFGYALLHSVWIGALLYALVRAVSRLLARPGARHNLAYGALLALGAGFAYAFYVNFDASPVCENLLAVPLDLAALGLSGTPGFAPERSWSEALNAALPALAPWLSLGYLLGLFPALFLLLRDQRRSRILRTRALSALPATWAAEFTELLAAHPVTRRVRARLSARAGEVMTLGFWSPVIVFPVALAGNLTPEMARTILLHEIAHLRAYDHWLNYPQQILRTFFFYHPAAHALCRLIDREREHRCDDWVAARCADRRTYATALVTVARYSLYPQNSLAMSATKTHFSSRVERLFRGEQQRRGHFAFSLAFICLLGAGHLSFTTLGADAGAVDCLEERGLTKGSSGPDINPIVLDADGHEVNVPLEDVVARLTERELIASQQPVLPARALSPEEANAPETMVIAALENGHSATAVNTDTQLPEVAVARDTTPPAKSNTAIRIRGNEEMDMPIFVVDGKVITAGTIDDIDPDNIKSVSVLKGTAAEAGYGAAGLERGVVLIETKDGAQPAKLVIGKVAPAVSIKSSPVPGEDPIYTINGRVVDLTGIEDIDPKSIESISVFKGKSARESYGAEGVRRGVVMIKLKEGFLYSADNQVIHGELLAPGNLVDQNAEYLPRDANKTGYLINGKKVRYARFKALRAEEIREIKITSTPEAVRKAGFRGKEKVVMVTTW